MIIFKKRNEEMGLKLRVMKEKVIVRGGLLKKMRRLKERMKKIMVGIMVRLLKEEVIVMLGKMKLVK